MTRRHRRGSVRRRAVLHQLRKKQIREQDQERPRKKWAAGQPKTLAEQLKKIRWARIEEKQQERP